MFDFELQVFFLLCQVSLLSERDNLRNNTDETVEDFRFRIRFLPFVCGVEREDKAVVLAFEALRKYL